MKDVLRRPADDLLEYVTLFLVLEKFRDLEEVPAAGPRAAHVANWIVTTGRRSRREWIEQDVRSH